MNAQQNSATIFGFFGGKGKGASPKGDFSDAVVGASRGGILSNLASDGTNLRFVIFYIDMRSAPPG